MDLALVISTTKRGTVWFSQVSLFPPTFNNRPNGNRPDLMQLLADMQPKFLRFPGGNYLEGNTIATRFNWKETIGDIDILVTSADVAAVMAGLGDGTIDAIATDHAPHTQEVKEQAFDEAPPGMLGLQTALALARTELALPVERVIALLSWQPAAIAGIGAEHGGPIVEGAPANLCVLDPTATWTVDPDRLASRSRNTPYAGRTLTGLVRHTVLRGEPVVVDGEAQR